MYWELFFKVCNLFVRNQNSQGLLPYQGFERLLSHGPTPLLNHVIKGVLVCNCRVRPCLLCSLPHVPEGNKEDVFTHYMMQRPVGLQIYWWMNIFRGWWECERQALCIVILPGALWDRLVKHSREMDPQGACLNVCFAHKLIYTFTDIANALKCGSRILLQEFEKSGPGSFPTLPFSLLAANNQLEIDE